MSNTSPHEYRPGCVYCVLKGHALENVLATYGDDDEVLGQMATARGMPELLVLAQERKAMRDQLVE